MVKLYEDTNIKAIADAIRAKNGTTNTYKTSEMAGAISAISGVDALLDKSITAVNSGVTNIGKYALYNCTKLTTANFPNVTKIDTNAFEGCSALATISIPNITSISSSSFAGCSTLEIIDLKNVIVIPSSAFKNCHLLKAVVLRASSECVLSGSVFSGCYHMLGTTNSTYNPNGLADGYIYVPSALVDGYLTSNSTTVYKFRTLENYTVDGTVTGELDLSKI